MNYTDISLVERSVMLMPDGQFGVKIAKGHRNALLVGSGTDLLQVSKIWHSTFRFAIDNSNRHFWDE